MPQKIVIDNPCDADWNNMNKNASGRHCDICSTTVVDFTRMSLQDIETYFKTHSGEKVCGRYHARHVQSEKSNAWYDALNKFESLFSKTLFKKAALGIISIALLISCKTKKKTTNTLTGADRYYMKKPVKIEKSILSKRKTI